MLRLMIYSDFDVFWIEDSSLELASYKGVSLRLLKGGCGLARNVISNIEVIKSIVDDFNMEPGVVSMKVVLVLRSAEI